MFSKSNKLAITPSSSVVLLNPWSCPGSAEGSPEGYESTIIRGYVTLILSKPRHLPTLVVDLICRQTVNVDGINHTYAIRQASTQVPVRQRMLAAGKHTFHFALEIPADIAPSDRTTYGQTIHKLIARTPGLAKIKTQLTAVSSIQIVPLHRDLNGLPPGFNLETVVQNANLGDVEVDMFSRHLITAGFVHLNLKMPRILRKLRLHEVRVNVEQIFDLHCIDEQDKRSTSRMEVLPVATFRVNDEELERGGNFALSRHLRLLDETRIRPSTPEHAVTGLRVSHKLTVTIIYLPLENNPGQKTKEYRIASPAVISSCHCLLDSLQLPAYSEKEAETQDGRSKAFAVTCLCSMSAAQAVAVYGAHRDTHADSESIPQCISLLKGGRSTVQHIAVSEQKEST